MKLFFINALLFSLVFILGGCHPAATVNNTNANAVSVTDADGKIVTITDSSRIVSIGTATTETIYALGAGERVVAVDNSSREYIPESKNLRRGGFDYSSRFKLGGAIRRQNFNSQKRQDLRI